MKNIKMSLFFNMLDNINKLWFFFVSILPVGCKYRMNSFFKIAIIDHKNDGVTCCFI